MKLAQLETIVINALEEIKGRDIEIIDTTKLTALFERMIIVSGDSNRQVRSLANHVAVKVKEAGGEVLSTEGEEGGDWVLVDLGEIIVHAMQPTVRAYYNIEELWGGKGPERVRNALSPEVFEQDDQPS